MIRLLTAAAAAQPDRVAVVTPEGSPTWAELLRDARAVAATIDTPRFAVVEPDAAWVVRLLAGAALAGVEPCQYQPDTPAAELVPQLAAFGHDVVVTRRDDLVDALTAAGVSVLRPDALLTPSTRGDSTTPRADAAQPLLIRTTGTTGEPKAARHDWRVLERTVAGATPRPHQRWLLAYGPQQFAGIQVLLHVVATRATLVAPFPRQPRDGLAALLDQDVTCVSATPTYWRFLLTEARSQGVDLPGLEQVTLGGEAIPPDLLDDLRGTFPSARISQVYASTEFGSIVSVGDGRAGFSTGKLLSDANPEAHLKVVDGELWVRRTPGMLGYADGSAATSCEVAAGATSTHDVRGPDDEWRPTGDLVEVVGDRVEFRGRDSEVINVGGVKVHPLPVENAIAGLDGVALARVFGRANRLTGAIVAVEVVAEDGADHDDVRRRIKAAVADLPRAWQPRSISFVEAIDTLGSKTLRRMES